MRAVMGLVSARDGAIQFGGSDLRAVPAFERADLGIGYLPEDRRLMPHLSAEENATVLVLSQSPKAYVLTRENSRIAAAGKS